MVVQNWLQTLRMTLQHSVRQGRVSLGGGGANGAELGPFAAMRLNLWKLGYC